MLLEVVPGMGALSEGERVRVHVRVCTHTVLSGLDRRLITDSRNLFSIPLKALSRATH